MIEYLDFMEGSRIVLNGHEVPRLRAFKKPHVVSLVLDNRFGLDVPPNLAEPVVSFIANALAIGAGYSCFGENSSIANPYKVRMMGIEINPEGDE